MTKTETRPGVMVKINIIIIIIITTRQKKNITASGIPRAAKKRKAPALTAVVGAPTVAPPLTWRSCSAALVMSTVIARQMARMKLTIPHSLLTPPTNFPNGSTASDIKPSTTEFSMSPNAPACTPAS